MTTGSTCQFAVPNILKKTFKEEFRPNSDVLLHMWLTQNWQKSTSTFDFNVYLIFLILIYYQVRVLAVYSWWTGPYNKKWELFFITTVLDNLWNCAFVIIFNFWSLLSQPIQKKFSQTKMRTFPATLRTIEKSSFWAGTKVMQPNLLRTFQNGWEWYQVDETKDDKAQFSTNFSKITGPNYARMVKSICSIRSLPV